MSELDSLSKTNLNPVNAQQTRQELFYFQRNQHTFLEESGIAETARLALSDEALEDMNESTAMSIFMNGGIDPDYGHISRRPSVLIHARGAMTATQRLLAQRQWESAVII